MIEQGGAGGAVQRSAARRRLPVLRRKRASNKQSKGGRPTRPFPAASQAIDRLAGFGRRVEAPTWVLIALIYGGWLALTYFWRVLPIWFLAPVGAWLCAWHMSLQHEVIHGHPTRSAWINDLIGFPPLSLWLSYDAFRRSHLQHHRNAYLTDPLADPESNYMTPEAWMRAGQAERAAHLMFNTLLGRLTLGPARAMLGHWRREVRRIRSARPPLWPLLLHGLAVGLVLWWVCGVCRIGLGAYIVCYVYPGTALIMIRSLAEHRAAERVQDRTAVVERAGPLGLLFLHNNLHILHHARPDLPWYALPAQWRSARQALLSTQNGPVYQGYGAVARRYFLRPRHIGPHPFASPLADRLDREGASGEARLA